MNKTEREKMLANEPYLSTDPELVAMRQVTQRRLYALNTAAPDNLAQRQDILRSLFDKLGSGL